MTAPLPQRRPLTQLIDRLEAINVLYRTATRDELPIPALSATTDGMPPVLRFRSEQDATDWADAGLIEEVEPVHLAGDDLGRYIQIDGAHGTPKVHTVEVRWPQSGDDVELPEQCDECESTGQNCLAHRTDIVGVAARSGGAR